MTTTQEGMDATTTEEPEKIVAPVIADTDEQTVGTWVVSVEEVVPNCGKDKGRH
jgi:hypothetical protein